MKQEQAAAGDERMEANHQRERDRQKREREKREMMASAGGRNTTFAILCQKVAVKAADRFEPNFVV